MKTFHCLCVCLCVTLLSIGFSASALAEDYFLNTIQPSGNSWMTADDWTPNGAASAGNNYYVGGVIGTTVVVLRTPTTTSSTFPDAALYIGYSKSDNNDIKVTPDVGALGIKSKNATNSTVTINNLIVGGISEAKPASIRNSIGLNTTATLKGNITINGYAEFSVVGDNATDTRKLIVNSTIKGAGAVKIAPQKIAGNNNINVEITSNVASTPYSGAVTVPARAYLILSGTALRSASSITVGGKMDLKAGNAISASSSVVNDGVINYGTTSQTFKALTGTGSITGTGALTLANDTDVNSTYAGTITGTGASVTKTGTGMLTLSGANTYSGGTTISSGTLTITNSEALGTGAITLNGGTLSTTASETIVLDESVAINANSTIDTTNGLTLSGSISGTAALTKTGTGTLTLSGANTYSGGTTISAGTLDLGIANAISASSSVVNNGVIDYGAFAQQLNALTGTGSITGTGALTLFNDTAVDSTYSGTITGMGASVTKTGTGTLTLSGANSYTGGTTVSAGTLDLGVDNAIASSASVENNAAITFGTTSQTLNALTGSGSITGSGALMLFNDTDVNSTYAGTITGTGASVTKTGTGTLTLSGANEYSGGTTVSAGTLNLGIANAISASSSVVNNGVINYGAFTQQLNALTGTGSINGTGALTLFNGTAVDSTYSGTITGMGASVTKTGTGTLTLSGTNEYSGGTTVSAGTLNLGVANAISASSSVVNNGVIDYGAFAQTFKALTGSGSINGSGALTLFNDTEVNSTYSGTITGTGASVTKTGTGTLTLSGTNEYSGGTTVSAGTLNLGVADAIKESTSITNNAAITADSAQTFNNLSGTVDTASINIGTNALTLNNTAESIYNGNLTAQTITATGSEGTTLKLNGTINGNVTVSSGKLDIKGALIGGLEVSAGSIFSPGNSIGHTEQTGDFTLRAGAEILYELSDDDYDWLHVIGTAKFEKDSIIALSYTGALPSSAKSYELLTSTELILNEANFNWNQILIDARLNTANWSWNIANNNIVLNYAPTVVPVPEPSTWALLILGALGMMYFRRKK